MDHLKEMQSFPFYDIFRLIVGRKHWDITVAVTDLFPFANQCPRQAIRLYTDQSGTERIDSFFLSKTIFSSPFW